MTTESMNTTAVAGPPLTEWLGPLPEAAFPVVREGDLQTACWEVDCYTAEQMRAYAAQERAAEREKWRAAVFALWDCSRDAAPDMEPDEYAAWLAVGEILRA